MAIGGMSVYINNRDTYDWKSSYNRGTRERFIHSQVSHQYSVCVCVGVCQQVWPDRVYMCLRVGMWKDKDERLGEVSMRGR